MPAAAFSPRKANRPFYLADKFRGAKSLYTKLSKHQKSVAYANVNANVNANANANMLDDIDLSILRGSIKRDFGGEGVAE